MVLEQEKKGREDGKGTGDVSQILRLAVCLYLYESHPLLLSLLVLDWMVSRH